MSAPRMVPTKSVLFDLLYMVWSCDEIVGTAIEHAMIRQGYLKSRPRRRTILHTEYIIY